MSGPRKTWTDGEAATTPELQRSADSGAFADDRALLAILESLYGFTGDKAIVPMIPDRSGFPGGAIAAPSSSETRLLYLRTSTVAVRPLLVVIGDRATAAISGDEVTGGILMSGLMKETLEAPAFASNSSGLTRTDTIYLAIQQTVSATGDRKVKNPTTGIVATQTLNLETKPVVTIGVATGPASIPSDDVGAGIYYIALGTIAIQNGYTSGGALASPTNAITETWPRTGIRPEALATARPTSASGLGGSSTGGIDLPPSFRSEGVMWTSIGVTTTPATLVIDNSIDWVRRMIRVEVIQTPKHDTSGITGYSGDQYPQPTSVKLGGAGLGWESVAAGPENTQNSGRWDSGWNFTGDGGNTANNIVIDGFTCPGFVCVSPYSTSLTASPFAAQTGDSQIYVLVYITRASPTSPGVLTMRVVNGSASHGGVRAMVRISYSPQYMLEGN